MPPGEPSFRRLDRRLQPNLARLPPLRTYIPLSHLNPSSVRLHRYQPKFAQRAGAGVLQPARNTEQHIKEGKHALKWTRLSCRRFRHNAVRLQLHTLAYNLGNFMRTLALPDAVEQWSLTTLREKLVKIGAKIVRHGRYVIFQMAEVAVSRDLFADILRCIDRLRPKPAPP